MVLYLIRHGQSWNNALENHLKDRMAEPPLTEAGQIQAERVADYVKQVADKTDGAAAGAGYGITRLYCSAMLRTLQTAAPIGRALDLDPRVWVDVHEVGGVWLDEGDGQGPRGCPGLTRSEIEAQFPGFILPERIGEEGWWGPLKETPDEMVDRARRVVEAIGERFLGTEERVAIVSHGGFIDGLIQAILQSDGQKGAYFNNHNTAINRMDLIDGLWGVCYLNRVEHLSPELVT